jgi:hypothetical protein
MQNIEYDGMKIDGGERAVLLHLYNRLKQWRNFGKNVVN